MKKFIAVTSTAVMIIVVSSFAAYASVSVETKAGDLVSVAMTAPKVTKNGVITPASEITPSYASGVADNLVVTTTVKDNAATVLLPNYAKSVNQPVVVHGWGTGKSADGKDGFLVLDPNDPWVVYEVKDNKPDLNTLAIGMVMYPDGKVVPLKSLGKGKLAPGPHPEL